MNSLEKVWFFCEFTKFHTFSREFTKKITLSRIHVKICEFGSTILDPIGSRWN
jgi:hypothetical protein